MKIPTPMLIEELKKPIDISLWDTNINDYVKF